MSLDQTLRKLDRAFRGTARVLAVPVIYVLRPFKIFAYRTRFELLKRLILEVTTFFDWAMIFAAVQNETMMLHWRIWKGNFVFGKAIMVVEYGRAAREISGPTVRGNNFMGVNIVSSQSFIFATNAPVLNQSPPVRTQTRQYIDQNMFTPQVLAMTQDEIEAACSEILAEWEDRDDMAQALPIRSTVLRVYFKILAQTTITWDDAADTTFQYCRRFAEASLFGRYLPALMGILGTKERVRRDVYFKLEQYGIDPIVVGLTLFAAMFSIGTIVMKCVDLAQEHDVDYKALEPEQRPAFVKECLRLYPTVTTVHKIVERDDEVMLNGRRTPITGGDELAYPFICANRNPEIFPDPDTLRLDRPPKVADRMLTFSAGPHSCPGRESGILVTVILLNRLSARYDLNTLKIFNPLF